MHLVGGGPRGRPVQHSVHAAVDSCVSVAYKTRLLPMVCASRTALYPLSNPSIPQMSAEVHPPPPPAPPHIPMHSQNLWSD